MNYIKSRDKFLSNRIDESLSNEVRFGGSYLGRLINTTWRLLGVGKRKLGMQGLSKQLRSELEYLTAVTRLKDKKDKKLFVSMVDVNFLDEIKNSVKDIDGMQEGKEKTKKIEDLISKCEDRSSKKIDDKEFESLLKEFIEEIKKQYDKIKDEPETDKIDNNSDSNNDDESNTFGESTDIEILIENNLKHLNRVISSIDDVDKPISESIDSLEAAREASRKVTNKQPQSQSQPQTQGKLPIDEKIKIKNIGLTKEDVEKLSKLDTKTKISIYRMVNKNIDNSTTSKTNESVDNINDAYKGLSIKIAKLIMLFSKMNNLDNMGDIGNSVKIFLRTYKLISNKIRIELEDKENDNNKELSGTNKIDNQNENKLIRYFIPDDKANYVVGSDLEKEPKNFYYSLCLIITKGNKEAIMDLTLNHKPNVVSLSKTILFKEMLGNFVDFDGDGNDLSIINKGKMRFDGDKWIVVDKIKAKLS